MIKKTTLYFLSIIAVSLSSCGTLSGIKKPVALIDFPDDLVIKNKETGEIMKIGTGVVAYSSRHRSGTSVSPGTTTTTNYIGQAVKFKPQKNISLELTSNGVSKTIKIGRKNNVVLLILEGIFTFGTFTAVDLITGGHKTHNPPFIDVKALFEDKEQRSYKEIFNYIKQNSH